MGNCEIIIGARQTGRTTKLISLAAEAEKRGEVSYIVCHNHEEAYRIAQQAKEMELFIGFPLTYNEFLQTRGRNISNLYIDNLMMLLGFITPIHIAAVVLDEHTT